MFCRWKLGLPNEGAERKIVPLPRIGNVEFIPGEVCEVGGMVLELVKNLPQLEWLDEKHEDVIEYLNRKNPVALVSQPEVVVEVAPESEIKNKKKKEE